MTPLPGVLSATETPSASARDAREKRSAQGDAPEGVDAANAFGVVGADARRHTAPHRQQRPTVPLIHARTLLMIADGKKAISDRIKAIHGHFYPIADHLKAIPDRFDPTADH